VNTISQTKDPDPRNKLYLQLVGAQLRELTEVEIADYFKRASAQEVFEELKGYGFPVCEVCGANPVVGNHCPKDKPKARRIEGNPEELPSIKNAATTFRDTINTLEAYLEHALTLKETLQGRYFVGEGKTQEDNIREVRGAQWHPHPYLVVLIAVSILEHHGNWGFVERLLNELHPRPSEANRKQLYKFITGRKVDERGRPIPNKEGLPQDSGDGFLDRAEQIAALMRGTAEIKRGRKGPDIPAYEHYGILHIRSLVDKGLSREEIMRREREEFEGWKEASLQDIREELEAEKAVLDQAGIEEYEHAIRQRAEEKYDEDEFYRLYNLTKDLQ
jgi:hypothetical protein